MELAMPPIIRRRSSSVDDQTPPRSAGRSLTTANYEVVSVHEAFASTTPIRLDDMVTMYDERIDHPAWRGVREASADVRQAIRRDFIDNARAAARDGWVPNDIALFFSVGREPLLS
jgi:hypothetical protein